MNRKNRKERLKRLNAQRKEQARKPFSSGFLEITGSACPADLEFFLEHMLAEAVFDDHPKLQARIEYLTKLLEHRKDHSYWQKIRTTHRFKEYPW